MQRETKIMTRMTLKQILIAITILTSGYAQAIPNDSNPSDSLTTDTLPAGAEKLGEVTVVTKVAYNSEKALVREQRQSAVVQSGISARQIEKSQDKDASEAIRRIPGISIIDDKYVMVRGLSQRYNNVWINSGAVPSSEADSRAFSFDIIPAGQIENMVIVKSPSPEYPADFTGGFILLKTKQTVKQPLFNISASLGVNTRTTFQDLYLGEGDHKALGDFQYYNESAIDPVASGLDNNWKIKRQTAIPEMKATLSYGNTWRTYDGTALGLIAAVNFTNGYKRLTNMENSLFGPYDVSNDKPIYLRRAIDDQYSHDQRLGAMLNMSLRPNGGDTYYEWNNILNVLTKNRFTERWGVNAQPDSINNLEYYYSKRLTYNTQLNGHHEWVDNQLEWSGGYSYATRKRPDRRMIERTDRTDATMGIYRISREYTDLNEHIASLAANYKHHFEQDEYQLTLLGGTYGEYRSRDYRARELQYGWLPDNTLPSGWIFNPDVPGSVLIDENYGPDKLFVYEEVNWINSYKAHQSMAAGYIAAHLEWQNLRLHAGVRYEDCAQTLKQNTRQYEQSLQNTTYHYRDFFPSVNVVWMLANDHQLRAAYGRSVNRPEFRELSPSVFYDFDLGSSVMGNYDLKAAYIDNVDLRYEWYPRSGEQISVALFYKHFKNPIEWTYTVAGGTDLVYSYINAKGANNYGVEVDIRKSLDFIGMNAWSLSCNASWIHSRVTFEEGTNNIDRPMQGQSPYLINAGLFFNPERGGWSASILYNIIGKRIIGVGNRYGNASDGSARTIPNSYEMPRHAIDLSVGKKWNHWQARLAVRDLLAQAYVFKQYEDVTIDGATKTISETNRRYRPGTNIYITLSYEF